MLHATLMRRAAAMMSAGRSAAADAIQHATMLLLRWRDATPLIRHDDATTPATT